MVDELLSLFSEGTYDSTAYLESRKEALGQEIKKLTKLALTLDNPETVGPDIRERERQRRDIERELSLPRPQPPNIKARRKALLQRTAEWKKELRANPKVARMLVKRLIDPIVLFPARPDYIAEADTKWIAWETGIRPEMLLDGLVDVAIHDVASPTGFEPVFWP